MQHFSVMFLFSLIILAGGEIWAVNVPTGAAPLVLLPATSSYQMAPHLEYFEDKLGSLTINDIAAQEITDKFRPVGKENPNFGMTSSVVWLRFTLKNRSPLDNYGRPLMTNDWLLDMGWIALGDIRLFVPAKTHDSWDMFEAGTMHPPEPGDDPLTKFCVFRLPLPPGEETWTYYVQVKSDAAMLLPMTLCTYEAYHQRSEILMIGYGIFYGLILAIILHSLIAYPWVKDMSLLWYAALLFFMSLYYIEFNMIRAQFLPIYNVEFVERMAHFFLASTLAFVGPFHSSFLQFEKRSRIIDRLTILYAVLAVPGVVMTFLPFVGLQFLKNYDAIVACGGLAMIVSSTFISWRNRYRPAQILPVAWLILGAFGFKHILTLWGYLPVTQWSFHSIQIGVAAVSVVFSYAVWYRLKLIRESRDRVVRESEMRYRILAENVTDIIWTMDAGGHFTYISPSIERVTGWTVDEAMKRRLEDFLPPQSIEIARKMLSEGFSEKLEGWGHSRILEIEQYRKDKSFMLAEIKAAILRDEKGHPREILGVTRDITERKQQEEERRHLETQMQSAQKLESLGVLAGGIAHDFNNLLVAVLGYASLLLARLAPQSQEWNMVQQIEKAGERAAELARQMLAYSGHGKFIVEPLNLNELIGEMADLLRASLSKKAALNLQLAKSLPYFEGDATQIRQVVMNLIINASESLGEKEGNITLRTSVIAADRNILARTQCGALLPEGDYVCMEVEDTGCGMDEQTLSKIFDPFFTTKFTGRGLGLAATLGIVRSHSAAIEVFSVPAKGSKFTVLFPVSSNAKPPNGNEKALETLRWHNNGTLLVIDDEESIHEVVSAALKEMGLRFFAAKDGQEGVEVYRQYSDEISAVLLDMTMPRLSGEQVFEELKRIRPDVRVILSSGYSEEDIGQLFAGKGLADFIQKPYRIKELKEKIRKVLSGN